MIDGVVTVLGMGTGIIGCLIGVWGYQQSRTQQTSEDAQWKGEINTKLDTIINIDNGQNIRIDALADEQRRITERVAISERDIKSAHKRIDGIPSAERR